MSDSLEYVVDCAGCQTPFDALAAEWCSCLTGERSLVCPSCGSCFCKAKASYNQKFWRDAPREMWERKTREIQTPFEPVPHVSPAEVVRPLVLIVDDDKIVQRIASRVVESLGYGVILAPNGEEGLKLAREYKPEVVLTDALMPQMDGREMGRRIKEDPETAGTKVVVMTALYTSVKYQSEAYKSFKVDEYLSKPLDVNQLRTVLKKHAG